jgi:hypothetical protein
MLPAQVLPTIFGTKKGKIANNIKVIMVEAGGIYLITLLIDFVGII